MSFCRYILSIYILFLSVEPGLAAMCAYLTNQKVNCCDSYDSCEQNLTNSDEKKPANTAACNENCNPLKVCNNCIGYVITPSINTLAMPPVLFLDNHMALYSNNLFPPFSVDFWQPPKYNS